MNHSSQLMSLPKTCWIKPMATIFCAAAVLIPIFQRLSACATAIMRTPAKVLPFSRPKARMMPMTIGTMQETRAVVDGTKKLRRKPTKITPMTRRFDLTPICDMTMSAIRLSSPVIIMPAERNIAPATNAHAVVEKPARPILRAFAVPKIASGFAGFGDNPSPKDMNVTITKALTGYETPSVIQMMTANTRIAISRCPSVGRSAGVGSRKTSAIPMSDSNSPYFLPKPSDVSMILPPL